MDVSNDQFANNKQSENVESENVELENAEKREGGSELEDPEQSEETTQLRRTERVKRVCMGVWAAVGIVVLAAVVLFLLDLLSLPVAVIIWTCVIVFCLHGPVNWFEKKGIPRVWGTLMAYALMVVVLAIIVVLLFSPVFGIGDQFSGLVKSVPSYVDSLSAWANDIYTRYSDILQNDTVRQWINDALDSLGSWATDLARNSAQSVVAMGTAVINSFVAIGFGVVIAFWVLMELPAIGRECRRLVGNRHNEDAEMLYYTVTRVMGGYITGTLLQCAVIALGCIVLFGIVGIPNFVALGLIAGLLNIIPIVGPWLGGALAAVVGVFVSPVIAIVALIGTIVIQQLVYTFVSPKIMQNAVDIHPAFTFIALLAGSAIGGAMGGLMGSLLGMLAAIPTVAIAKSVFVYYFEKRTGRQLVSEDGVFFKGEKSTDENLDPVADATGAQPDERTENMRRHRRNKKRNKRSNE